MLRGWGSRGRVGKGFKKKQLVRKEGNHERAVLDVKRRKVFQGEGSGELPQTWLTVR